MLLAKATVVCSLMLAESSLRQRKQAYIAAGDSCNGFEIATTNSVEDRVKIELMDIPGVRSVDVTALPKGFVFDIKLDNLDFSTFEKVSARELKLYDDHPDLEVHFNIRLHRAEFAPDVANAA